MPDPVSSEADVGVDKESDEHLLQAMKDFIASSSIEDFVPLCHSCMTEHDTCDEVEKYLIKFVTEMAEGLVAEGQHLAAVCLTLRCGMPRLLILRYINLGRKAHRRKGDPIRALINIEVSNYYLSCRV